MTKEKDKEADKFEGILRPDREEHAMLEKPLDYNKCAWATMQVAEGRKKEERTGLKAECEHHGLSQDTSQDIANQLVRRVEWIKREPDL